MRKSLFLLVCLFALGGLFACAAPTTAPASPSPPAPTKAAATANTPVSEILIPRAQATPSSAPTATPQPSNTPAPTNTPASTATPTLPPAQLVQLMQDGCCASPFWAPDSQSVLFIDKPNATAPTGIYRVPVDRPLESELWTERIAFYTREMDYAQIPEQAGTRLIRLSDGNEVRIKNRGRTVQISPDRTRIVWSETRETFPIENRVTNIMLAKIDGSEPQRVLQTLRGGVSGWLDENRLLVSGRASRETTESTLFVYDLRDQARTEIVRAERLRLTLPSRGGTWIAYVITNDADPARNGLWLARTDGSDTRKLDFFGALQWRDDERFIYAPFEMNAPTHSFYEYNARTGESRRLTPPDQPFKIASGDWSVSPDGSKIIFVNAADNNLWLWQLQ